MQKIKKMQKKNPTLQDIADRIGCARNTVSLALRGSTRISLKRRHQVEKVARQIGYVPNLAARNLTTRKSGLIGVYIENAKDDVRVGLLNCLVDGLHSIHYKPVFGTANPIFGEKWYMTPWIQSFHELNVEALVLVKGLHKINRHEAKILKRFPSIIVGCEPDICYPLADCVALNRREAGRIGIEHLLDRGKSNICICSYTPEDAFAIGCMDALGKAGLKHCGSVKTYPSQEEMNDFCVALLACKPKPTAIIFGDSAVAVRFLNVIIEKGINDMAVVGYDYFTWADYLKVPLTTIEQPLSEMASLTIDLVRHRLAEPDAPKIQHVLHHRLVIRESTGGLSGY